MKKEMLAVSPITLFLFLIVMNSSAISQTYPIIDTGQDLCYDTSNVISCPQPGSPFYGQDAQYQSRQFSFQDNGDGTVTDLNTGLMWQQMPELYNKKTFNEALAEADTFSLAGYNDWRLPTIKELYSLIDFRGSSMMLSPYIDTSYFGFRFGDTSLGERVIDGQYWSSTRYVGFTMNGDSTAFGVNFADGRIKGYPAEPVGPPGNEFTMKSFVRYVRGNPNYGINNFVDNGDGTVTDLATGLMWQKDDNGDTLNWVDALDYAENLSVAEYDDWRLPNAKELQSIVDYTRAPDAVNPSQQGTAIDPIFNVTKTESWYWTSTTLLESPPEFGGPGGSGIYVTFGQAFGWMEQPPGSGNYVRLNVHGAGAQRGDPKVGDPNDFPIGFGPQGDEIRIYNYIRCVRDAGTVEINENDSKNAPSKFSLQQNYPNPFNPETTIAFSIKKSGKVTLKIYNTLGEQIVTLIDQFLPVGEHRIIWQPTELPSGAYYYNLSTGSITETKKMMLVR